MESDNMSLASDFTRISESMMNADEFEEMGTNMTASFFHSQHSGDAASENPLEENIHFNKVKFTSVQLLGADDSASLSVIYHTAEDFVPKSSDRVALYKVGFSSSKDFLCYKWVPCSSSPPEHPVPYTVIFEDDILPKETEEFYQMCYLMQNGKISGVSMPFQLMATKDKETQEQEEIENAARNVLSIRIQKLLKENEEIKNNLKESEDLLAAAKSENDKVGKEKSAINEEKEEMRIVIERLKETISQKDDHIEKYKIEILDKEEEMRNDKAHTKELQEKLTMAVMNLDDMKESLAGSIEVKTVTEERLEVVLQDSKDLKERIQVLKEELETCLKEKYALEKIASDLSQRLQKASEESHTLTQVNARLVRKIKKLKKVVGILEASAADDFIRVYQDPHEDDDDDGTNKSEITSVSAPAMTTSVMSSVCPSSGASACPHQLNETVITVSRRMDEIVSQLSLQTEEMKSLKKEIALRKLAQEREKLQENSLLREALLVETVASTMASSQQNVNGGDPEAEQKMIYEHSFLPANITAPVFLPASGGDSVAPSEFHCPAPPTAPSPTPSMLEESTTLPAPLQPVATPTARNAAVLRQFSDLVTDAPHRQLGSPLSLQQEISQSLEEQQQQQQESSTLPEGTQLQQRESDDEDYHSTGNSMEHPPMNPPVGPLKCPMCPLEFMPRAIRLMEEHINNHLDRTCPVCSLAFQRNVLQKTYEEHVQSHFSDEEEDNADPPQDSSGPWDPRSFQLLEID